MPLPINIPFKAFSLQFHSGMTLVSPLMDKQVLHVDPRIEVLSGKYTDLFEREILNQGQLHQLLSEINRDDFDIWDLSVSFPAARNGISFPAFSLSFYCFYQQKGQGYWGMVPTLGLEAYGKTEEDLASHLEEAIQMDFARNKRLSNVRKIVSAIWWDTVDLYEVEQTVTAPNPRELEEITQTEGDLLLLKIAHRISPTKQQVFQREKELTLLLNTFQSLINVIYC